MSDSPFTQADALPVLIRNLVVGLVVLAAVSFLAGQTLSTPIEIVGQWVVSYLGLPGIFLGSLVLDSVPFSMSEPLLLAGYQGGIGFWTVTTVAGVGSWMSGGLGWVIGRFMGTTLRVQQLFVRYRAKAFMHRYGSAFVAVGAITPFPYAITTYAAGASGLSLSRVMVSALLRFPKTWVYMYLVIWSYQGGLSPL